MSVVLLALLFFVSDAQKALVLESDANGHGRVAWFEKVVQSKPENFGDLKNYGFNYAEAKRFCEQKQARLIRPRSQQEIEEMQTALDEILEDWNGLMPSKDNPTKKILPGVYVDLHNSFGFGSTRMWTTSDGRKIWEGGTNGKPVDGAHYNWCRGEPTEYKTVHNKCVLMAWRTDCNWQWANAPCNNDWAYGIVYACEKDFEIPKTETTPTLVTTSTKDVRLRLLQSGRYLYLGNLTAQNRKKMGKEITLQNFDSITKETCKDIGGSVASKNDLTQSRQDGDTFKMDILTVLSGSQLFECKQKSCKALTKDTTAELIWRQTELGVACVLEKANVENRLTAKIEIVWKNKHNRCTEATEIICKATTTAELGQDQSVFVRAFLDEYEQSTSFDPNTTTRWKRASTMEFNSPNATTLGNNVRVCEAIAVSGLSTGHHVVLSRAIHKKEIYCVPSFDLELVGKLTSRVDLLETVVGNLQQQLQLDNSDINIGISGVGFGLLLLLLIAIMIAYACWALRRTKPDPAGTSQVTGNSGHRRKPSKVTTVYDDVQTQTQTQPVNAGTTILAHLYTQKPSQKQARTQRSFASLKHRSEGTTVRTNTIVQQTQNSAV